MVDDGSICFLVKKNPFATVPGAWCVSVKVNNQEKSKKIKKTRLECAQKQFKKPVQFRYQQTMDWWDHEQGRVWRREGATHDPKYTTSLHHLVPLDLLMEELLIKTTGWTLKCLVLFYALWFSQMLYTLLDGDSQCKWMMTQSILWKQP